MKRFIKISKSMLGKIGLNESYLYGILCWKSDWTNNYKINDCTRAYLAKTVLGSTSKRSLDTITKYTNKLEKAGFITKRLVQQSGDQRYVEYTINPTEFYISVYEDFFINMLKVSSKAKGLLLQLCCLAFNDTNTVKYSTAEICKKLGISYKTYVKYHNELLQDGIMTEDGYIAECFLKKTMPHKYEEAVKNFESAFIYLDKNSKPYKLYQQVLKYIDTEHFTRDQVITYKYWCFAKILGGCFVPPTNLPRKGFTFDEEEDSTNSDVNPIILL